MGRLRDDRLRGFSFRSSAGHAGAGRRPRGAAAIHGPAGCVGTVGTCHTTACVQNSGRGRGPGNTGGSGSCGNHGRAGFAAFGFPSSSGRAGGIVAIHGPAGNCTGSACHTTAGSIRGPCTGDNAGRDTSAAFGSASPGRRARRLVASDGARPTAPPAPAIAAHPAPTPAPAVVAPVVVVTAPAATPATNTPSSTPAAPEMKPVATHPAKANNSIVPGKEPGFTPISAPPLPISAAKQRRWMRCSAQYKADQISPEQYQNAARHHPGRAVNQIFSRPPDPSSGGFFISRT